MVWTLKVLLLLSYVIRSTELGEILVTKTHPRIRSTGGKCRNLSFMR